MGEAEERAVQCMLYPLVEGYRQLSKEGTRGENTSPYSLLALGISSYLAND